MARIPLWLGAAAIALGAATACRKDSDSSAPVSPASSANAVEIVAPAECSRHFAAVSRHLELGGVLYGYVDVDGDIERLAGVLRGVADSVNEAVVLAFALVFVLNTILSALYTVIVPAVGNYR